jgi:hypothetical protein
MVIDLGEEITVQKTSLSLSRLLEKWGKMGIRFPYVEK